VQLISDLLKTPFLLPSQQQSLFNYTLRIGKAWGHYARGAAAGASRQMKKIALFGAI